MDNFFLLVIAAVIPVAALCYYIYIKDTNKESFKLLFRLFTKGMLIVIPIVICETILQGIFPVDESFPNYFVLFFNVFISVGIIEEFFKWFMTRKFGYNDREFDEIYDIIVYSVFVSLGFAVVENVLYVLSNGIGNAIMRALTSIPGHTCFAISMGCFLAKAKIASLNKRTKLYNRNLILSLLIPTLLHTLYDFFAFSGLTLGFYGFHILMVIFCFASANKVSKMQINFSRNVSSGNVINNAGSIEYVAPANSNLNTNTNMNTNINENTNSASNMEVNTVNFCPVCGSRYRGGSYCGSCGFKIR